MSRLDYKYICFDIRRLHTWTLFVDIPRGAYNEMNLPAYHFPFDEITGVETPAGDIVPQDEGWKLQVSCPGVDDLVSPLRRSSHDIRRRLLI